jgi:tRNA-modifying protein YgfZ
VTVYDLTGVYGLLRITGVTRLDFVHRMSSGEVRNLMPGLGAQTCFTTPLARVVDCSIVLCDPDELLLLTGAGNADRLSRWLRKYVFFNDDVQLTVEPDPPISAEFGLETVLPAYSHKPADGVRGVQMPAPLPGVLRLGAPIPADAATRAAYESLRVAAGLPAFPDEINDAHIPLETGVWNAVSFSKGCYIGQEIIARMESRNQIARKLVRFEVVRGSVGVGEAIGESGVVTSAAAGHALGYVRSVDLEGREEFETAHGALRVAGLVRA